MIDQLRALALFAKTVECGSFRAAAGELGLSPSVVSHQISQLETQLGVALLYRSTRRLSLTHEGEKLFTSAQTMLEAAQDGLNRIARHTAEPSGRLSVTAPATFARHPLVQDIAAFTRAYPKVALAIRFSDLQQDLIAEGIDLAIRVGTLPDSSLKAKKISTVVRKLVAAPAYLAQRNVSEKRELSDPEELRDWDWLGLSMRPDYKLFANDRGETRRIEFQPHITTDSVDAVCQLATAGLGLATPPDFLADPEIAAGHLVELLPQWSVDSLPVYAVWPPNAPRESLTHRFIRFLEEREGLRA